MKTIIYCKTTAPHIQSFYLTYNKKDYFLFNQAYRKSVKTYFANGKELNKALDFTDTRGNEALTRVTIKLPKYIKYIEQTEGIIVLEKTKKKKELKYKKCVDKIHSW